MKKCSYCGAEYPDEAMACAIDATPLGQDTPENPIAKQIPADKLPHLLYPDYRWTAWDAWKCLFMLMVFEIVIGIIYTVIDWHAHGFHAWRVHSGVGFFLNDLFYLVIGTLTAAYFARTDTFATFWKGFGLDRKPGEYLVYGLIAALILRFFSHILIVYGWSKGVLVFPPHSFADAFGQERFLFAASALLLAPLFEEIINRGFIYKAFRGSYSVPVSVALLVGWTALTHFNQFKHSWAAALTLSLLTVVQCHLREKSSSLWDTILCHFAFNVSNPIDGSLLR
jgi:membrane protease YdiL (CAAX protease family)